MTNIPFAESPMTWYSRMGMRPIRLAGRRAAAESILDTTLPAAAAVAPPPRAVCSPGPHPAKAATSAIDVNFKCCIIIAVVDRPRRKPTAASGVSNDIHIVVSQLHSTVAISHIL